jgi:DNA-binding transcriptional LysR family regulator
VSIESIINNIDWDKLRTFYFVAKAGGFTQASPYLNLAQSTLSRTIQNLEGELGFPVFIRHRNGIFLTKEGEILFKAAKNIFSELKHAIDEVESETAEPQGSLRLIVSGGLLQFYALPYIPGFIKKYPNINLTLVAADTVPSVVLLEADVVIRPKLPERDDLIQRHLLTNHVQLYASKDYLDQFGTPTKPEDLDHHRLIAFGDHKEALSFQAMNWHLTLGTSQGEVRIPYIQANTPYGRLLLAQEGIGITAISAEHPGLLDLKLIQILPDIEGPTVNNYFIYSKAHQNSKRIKVLEEYLLEAFSKDYAKALE